MQILATEIRGKFENYENVFISHRNPTDNEECFQVININIKKKIYII